MNEVKERVLLDLKVNKRCLQEDAPAVVKKILQLWMQYDYELLTLIEKGETKWIKK